MRPPTRRRCLGRDGMLEGVVLKGKKGTFFWVFVGFLVFFASRPLRPFFVPLLRWPPAAELSSGALPRCS